MRPLLALLLQYGVFGLFLVAVADDSFLFIPIGSDLVAVLLIARNHNLFIPCVAAASAGSVLGVYFLDLVCRKAGDEGLKRLMKPKLLNYMKAKMAKRAAMMLVISCIAPPPFPFGVAIGAASALQYPRVRLLTIVFFARAVRFALVGWSAIAFGRRILRIVNSKEFLLAMEIFIAICLIGSVFSIIQWVRNARRHDAGG
jgi:membrane protein YqaA with SNARE-associated domain